MRLFLVCDNQFIYLYFNKPTKQQKIADYDQYSRIISHIWTVDRYRPLQLAARPDRSAIPQD